MVTRPGWPGQRGSVDEEDVLPAVVVVVDEGDAGAEGFREKFFAEGAVVVDEVDAGFLGDVGEVDGLGGGVRSGGGGDGERDGCCEKRGQGKCAEGKHPKDMVMGSRRC